MNPSAITEDESQFQETIKAIAIRYGLRLDNDDPIVYVLAFNKFLIEKMGESTAKSIELFISNISILDKSTQEKYLAIQDELKKSLDQAIKTSVNKHTLEFEEKLKRIINEQSSDYQTTARNITSEIADKIKSDLKLPFFISIFNLISIAAIFLFILYTITHR